MADRSPSGIPLWMEQHEGNPDYKDSRKGNAILCSCSEEITKFHKRCRTNVRKDLDGNSKFLCLSHHCVHGGNILDLQEFRHVNKMDMSFRFAAYSFQFRTKYPPDSMFAMNNKIISFVVSFTIFFRFSFDMQFELNTIFFSWPYSYQRLLFLRSDRAHLRDARELANLAPLSGRNRVDLVHK